MSESKVNTSSALWRAVLVVVLCGAAWQSIWLFVVFYIARGSEFIDDTPVYTAYVRDPTMLFSDRHRNSFGAAVAPPLMPVELKAFHFVFAVLGDFLALRLTMLVHLVFALGVGFAASFRYLNRPRTARDWFWTAIIVVSPVAWVTSVVTVQDDSIAAAWAGVCLAAWMWAGPIAGAVAAGFGVFFGKVFLALALLGLWIASPGRRRAIAGIGAAFIVALFAFLFWRDGEFVYSQYVYAPYMGASPYGLVWMLAGEFNVFLGRNISLFATAAGLAVFIWLALRKRLSYISAVTGIHFLFLMTYFGAMPEYYVWFLPFLVVTLWAAYRRRLWGTFAMGWLSTFFAYAYKLVYGLNPAYGGSKANLKAWVAENVPLDVHAVQIAVGFAAVICTFAFALLVLVRDPARDVAIQNEL